MTAHKLTLRLGLAAVLALTLPACSGLSEFANEVAANMEAQDAANASGSAGSSDAAAPSMSREELMAAADAAVLQPAPALRDRVNCTSRPSKVERSVERKYTVNDGSLEGRTERGYLDRVDVTGEVLVDDCHLVFESDPHGGYGQHIYIVYFEDDAGITATENLRGTSKCLYTDAPEEGVVITQFGISPQPRYPWITVGPNDLGPAYARSTIDGVSFNDLYRNGADMISDMDLAILAFKLNQYGSQGDRADEFVGRSLFCSLESDATKEALVTVEYVVTAAVPEAE